MRLRKSAAYARLSRWNAAWKLHATVLDHAALAALVAAATYMLLGVF